MSCNCIYDKKIIASGLEFLEIFSLLFSYGICIRQEAGHWFVKVLPTLLSKPEITHLLGSIMNVLNAKNCFG